MMTVKMTPYIVYVQTDEQNRITAVDSSAFIADTSGWIEVDRGHDYRHHHAQANYFPQPIYDERAICRYKLLGGVPVERTAEEMDADYIAHVPVPDLPARVAALEEELTAAKILLGVE